MPESWTDSMFYTDGRGRRHRINRGSKEVVFSINRVLRCPRYGSEREPMDWYQGSKSKGALSGNTHAGWDAWDRSPFNTDRRSKISRIHGVMDHHRTRTQGPWVPHGHAGTDGGAGSAALQVQLAGYHRDDNGLRGNAPDRGFEMRHNGKRIFPLYVASWKPKGKHGIYLCEVECGGYEYESTDSKRLLTVERGMEVSISAVTAVVIGGEKGYWGITDTKGDTPGGEVIWMPNLKLVKEVGAFAA